MSSASEIGEDPSGLDLLRQKYKDFRLEEQTPKLGGLLVAFFGEGKKMLAIVRGKEILMEREVGKAC